MERFLLDFFFGKKPWPHSSCGGDSFLARQERIATGRAMAVTLAFAYGLYFRLSKMVKSGEFNRTTV